MNKTVNNKITEIQNDTTVMEKLYGIEKQIRTFDEQIGEFRQDHKSFKSLIEQDLDLYKSIAHNLTDETNAQLRVFEKNLTKLSMPELEKIEEKVQFVEHELINIKNMNMKALSGMKTQGPDLTPVKVKSKEAFSKVDTSHIKSLGEELDEISLFIQRFADSHVTDQVRVIKDTEYSIK